MEGKSNLKKDNNEKLSSTRKALNDSSKSFKIVWGFSILIVVILFIVPFLGGGINNAIQYFSSKTFRIISSESNKLFDDEIEEYAKEKGIDIEIDHYGDLEIVDILNSEDQSYDAVWISNSIWLYMLDNSYLISDSKSIAMDPVVMGVSMSKAKELGFVGEDIYNKDILDAVSSNKLKYVMTSVTKTNTGATAYLGFLNSLAGSPEVLTSEMLKDETLVNNMKSFFKGVERVSGDEEYLQDMFLNGKYEAVINYESTLISLNKKLTSQGKEPLYLLYPVDGVALNDMPFGYISRGQDEKKKEDFKTLQDFLRSDKVRKKLEDKGFRSWYGGVKLNPSEAFNKEWGIDTSKYLTVMKYPSKGVMNDAFDLYADVLRKPAHVVFCLDVSGSMSGDGIRELKESMRYILDRDSARKDRIQFSDSDKITIITFNYDVSDVTETTSGEDTSSLIEFVDNLSVGGGTNIYDPAKKAMDILKEYDSDTYTRTVILMTDGQSNNGSFYDFSSHYSSINQNIPVYSITFGDAYFKDLDEISSFTNGKVFDGKNGLKKAFGEVRSYS